jgi:hypothetical protein
MITKPFTGKTKFGRMVVSGDLNYLLRNWKNLTCHSSRESNKFLSSVMVLLIVSAASIPPQLPMFLLELFAKVVLLSLLLILLILMLKWKLWVLILCWMKRLVMDLILKLRFLMMERYLLMAISS